MKNTAYSLTHDEKLEKVSFDGRTVSFSGKNIAPNRASLDVRRVIPMYIAVIVVVGIVFVGMMIGALLGTMEGAIVSVSVAGGAGVIAYLALSRMEQVLMIDTRSGAFEFRGDVDDLRSLYYEISKVTIKKMKEKEKKESSSMKGVGITKGEKLFGKEELKNVKSDMKRSGIINKKVITQICPECGHDELYLEGGLIAGHIYHCKKCDYVGSFVLEREIDFKDDK